MFTSPIFISDFEIFSPSSRVFKRPNFFSKTVFFEILHIFLKVSFLEPFLINVGIFINSTNTTLEYLMSLPIFQSLIAFVFLALSNLFHFSCLIFQTLYNICYSFYFPGSSFCYFYYFYPKCVYFINSFLVYPNQGTSFRLTYWTFSTYDQLIYKKKLKRLRSFWSTFYTLFT